MIFWGGEVYEKAPHVIAIRGELTREGDGSYEELLSAVARESGDFTLDIDCYGGDAIGLIAAARQIAATGRAHAHVSGVCASAAYVLAAACEDITAVEDAQIGSVGVMTYAPEPPPGYRTSRWSPRKNMPDQQVDELLDSDCARALRFVSVRRGFGEEDLDRIAHRCSDGAMMTAAAALERGLIDRIAPAGGIPEVEMIVKKELAENAPEPAVAPVPAPEPVDIVALVNSTVQGALAPLAAQLQAITARLAESAPVPVPAQEAQVEQVLAPAPAQVAPAQVAPAAAAAASTLDLSGIERRLNAIEAQARFAVENRVSSGAHVEAKADTRTPAQRARAIAKEQGITFTAALCQLLPHKEDDK